MKRPLHELHAISEEHQCPIVCAGDIFDKWNAPAELINFAIDNMPPDMYCIPGQHDLPLHNYEDIEKSAYWTLVKTSTIHHIEYHKPLYLREFDLVLYGFPWGKGISDISFVDNDNPYFCLAVIHSYIWVNRDNSYPGAPEQAQLQKWFKRLAGYNAAVFGDNHKGCEGEGHSIRTIFNCGTFMRRKVDEFDYQPRVGLLHPDGTVSPHYLDCSKDKFVDLEKEKQEMVGMDYDQFIAELGQLGAAALDFNEAVNRYLEDNQVPKLVKRVVLAALEEAKK